MGKSLHALLKQAWQAGHQEGYQQRANDERRSQATEAHSMAARQPKTFEDWLREALPLPEGD